MAGKRYITLSEIDEKSELFTPLIKSWTGNDEQTGRLAHGSKIIKFQPQGRLELNCNEMPVFKDSSNATYKRLICQAFENTFEDVEVETEFIKKKDSSLNARLTTNRMSAALLQILFTIYCDNYSIKKDITNIPNEVKVFTDEYATENDEIKKWFTKHYKIDESAPDIKPVDLYNQFIQDTASKLTSIKFGRDMKTKYPNNVLDNTISKRRVYIKMRRIADEDEESKTEVLFSKSEI